MKKISNIFKKICRKWAKIRLQPIRVFCIHHVCKAFDAESMNPSDWMNIESFKVRLMNMQKIGVKFISLQAAYKHIKHDYVRSSKYAIITFDDGYASLKEILPWLEEHNIPATLFVNGKYLDGKSYRANPKEHYLAKDELFALASSCIEIGSHGWDHTNAVEMGTEDFKNSIKLNIELLHNHPRYIPFHAYTWGKHTKGTDAYLQSEGIIPVYIDGEKNYNDWEVIHRELL